MCLSSLALAACSAGGGGGHTGAVKDDGTRGTPLIALGEAMTKAGKCDAPLAGTPPIRRISRIEYNNAVADLFGVDTHPADGFVPEEKTGVTIGFNTNIRSAVSSLAVEQYLSAAESIADLIAKNLTPRTGCASVDDAACIKAFLAGRARRAFRGTLPDDEKAQLLADYDGTAKDLGGDAALRFGVSSVLLSPRFLYTVEFGEGSAGVVALTGSEVAGRLAASLFRSVPNDALLASADKGELDTADGVMKTARAMLADPRAGAMLADFARQWLDVEATPSLTRDNMVFPNFNATVARSLLGEVEQFFTVVASDDKGNFAELLTARYTMVNKDVAQAYGQAPPAGADSGFVQMMLPPERQGVLTMPSVLAAHAHFNRESIVLRGKAVRFQILCDPLDPPPSNVDTTLQPIMAGTTERSLSEAHASIPGCSSCHTMMDPIGYAFGKFDAVGAYNAMSTEDISGKIAPPHLASKDDVSGTFKDPLELSVKLANSQDVRQCYVIQSLRYSMGRGEVTGDACSAFAAWEHFFKSGLSLKEVIVAITGSNTFRYRTSVIPGEACQ